MYGYAHVTQERRHGLDTHQSSPTSSRQRDGSPHASEITPVSVYESRRQWLKEAGLGGLGLSVAPSLLAQGAAVPAIQRPGKLAVLPASRSTVAGAMVSDKVTPHADVTTYNNFYEFGTDKDEPAQRAHT